MPVTFVEQGATGGLSWPPPHILCRDWGPVFFRSQGNEWADVHRTAGSPRAALTRLPTVVGSRLLVEPDVPEQCERVRRRRMASGRLGRSAGAAISRLATQASMTACSECADTDNPCQQPPAAPQSHQQLIRVSSRDSPVSWLVEKARSQGPAAQAADSDQ